MGIAPVPLVLHVIVVLVATAHSRFDYELLAEHARLIVDTRQAMKGFEQRMGDRLVRA